MRRGPPSLAAVAAALLLAFAGCGDDSSSYSNGEIERALDLERGSGAYEVGGDPFCRVTDLLHDGDEVAGINRRQRQLALTSRQGGVGVVVEPPFPPDCQQQVESGLNDLDPPPEKEEKKSS